MTKRKVTITVDDKTVENLKRNGVDIIKEVTDAVQADADAHMETIVIYRNKEKRK